MIANPVYDAYYKIECRTNKHAFTPKIEDKLDDKLGGASYDN